MILPSKKLLSAVLVINFEPYYVDNILTEKRLWIDNTSKVPHICWDEIPFGNEINIYELMHLMKEWLTKQGYVFSVYHHLDTVAISVLKKNDSGYISPSMSVLTEFEAVTKACEWILEQQ